MKISYVTSINVMNCGARMLDLIESELSTFAAGDGCICVTYENVQEYLEVFDKKGRYMAMKHEKELNKFLSKVFKGINPKALENDLHRPPQFGDVVFSK